MTHSASSLARYLSRCADSFPVAVTMRPNAEAVGMPSRASTHSREPCSQSNTFMAAPLPWRWRHVLSPPE